MSKVFKPIKFSKKEKMFFFQLFLATFIFVFGTLIYFSWFFIKNCVFEWPLRFDVKACWNEQIAPAKEKALQDASLFVP